MLVVPKYFLSLPETESAVALSPTGMQSEEVFLPLQLSFLDFLLKIVM